MNGWSRTGGSPAYAPCRATWPTALEHLLADAGVEVPPDGTVVGI